MRQLSALLCQLPCCLVLCCLSGQVMAQTTINRCIGAHGGAVFSDQPCSALQATRVGASKPTTTVSTTGTAVAPLPILCAASVARLRQSIIQAFARHDANRLAGLILWDGYGEGSVTGNIRSLDQLMNDSLLDITETGASGTNRDSAPAPSPGGIGLDPSGTASARVPAPDSRQLVLHTAGHDGPQERSYDLVRRAGCVWLRIAD